MLEKITVVKKRDFFYYENSYSPITTLVAVFCNTLSAGKFIGNNKIFYKII